MIKKIFSFILFLYAVVFIWQTFKPLEPGLSYESNVFQITEDKVDFLFDLSGENKKSHEIYDTILEHIEKADNYVLIDMFLFNSFVSEGLEVNRNIAEEVTAALIEKKTKNKEIKIDFITDRINLVYGGSVNKQLSALEEKGINVIYTDREKLKDSNYFYSPIWRLFFSWAGNSDKPGIIPHPFSDQEEKVSLRSYLDLLNFKANHRKIFISDYNGEMQSIVMSANLHNGSSSHSNVALLVRGNFWKEVYKAENAVAIMSGAKLSKVETLASKAYSKTSDIAVQLLTEKKIKQSLLSAINKTHKNDSIKMVMFYLSDREIIESLINAANREVDVKIVLDPNKDAFGFKKGGIPNRQVASELLKKTEEKINIRWFDTHGEQFHAKMTWLNYRDAQTKEETSRIYIGSTNLTKRNLNNYNLEANFFLEAPRNKKIVNEISSYYDRVWFNVSDNYTVPYFKYKDDSFLKKIFYRFQDASGMCSF